MWPFGRRRASARPTVSLTFDDGLASQRRAAALLDERGLPATFYVPSGLIGALPNRLAWDDVRSLAAAGHEIGGHTRTHVHLTEVPEEEARAEILRDHAELVAQGLRPATFAYPFGEHDERARRLVEEAGYDAGRAVGGIVESIPPRLRFALRTPHSARSSTTADDLAAFVHIAEHEGGWLLLVFHHVGEGAETDYTTSEADLTRFLDWLLTREVEVRRVCDVAAVSRRGRSP